MCCLACIEIQSGKMSFNEAFNELQKIPEGFEHRKEVEKLIKNHFNKDKELIRLDTLCELAKKYQNGKWK